MKTSVFALGTAAGLASTQCISSFPDCARPCLLTGTAAVDCAAADYTCQCSTANQNAIIANATNCVLTACGESVAINSVVPAASAFCSAINAGETCSTAAARTAVASTNATLTATATSTAGTSSTVTAATRSSLSPSASLSFSSTISVTKSINATKTINAAQSINATRSVNATVTSSSPSTTAQWSGASPSGLNGSASDGSSSTAGAADFGSINSFGMMVLGTLAFII